MTNQRSQYRLVTVLVPLVLRYYCPTLKAIRVVHECVHEGDSTTKSRVRLHPGRSTDDVTAPSIEAVRSGVAANLRTRESKH